MSTLESFTNRTEVQEGAYAVGYDTPIAGGESRWSWSVVKSWIQSTITKASIGLGNADNTSDANKPISTAVQAALDAKASTSTLSAHSSSTSNPHNVTKAQVGLGNVTNDAQVKRSEMGTALGVPTLDAAGRVPFAQLPENVGVGRMRLLLTVGDLHAVDIADFTDGEQVQVQCYSVVGDGGGGVFTYRGASAVTINLGTTFPTSSGVGRWHREFSGPINVRWFGARGDGTTNDGAALMAAVAASKATYFPPGHYICSATLTIPVTYEGFSPYLTANTEIFGAGPGATKITYTGSTSLFKLASRGGANIHGFNLVCASSDSTRIALNLNAGERSHVFHNTITGFGTGVAMGTEAVGDVFYVLIEANTFANQGVQGVILAADGIGPSNQNWVRNNKFHSTGTYGVRLTGDCYANDVSWNNFEGNISSAGVQCSGRKNVFINNYAELLPGAHSIHLTSSSDGNLVLGQYSQTGTPLDDDGTGNALVVAANGSGGLSFGALATLDGPGNGDGYSGIAFRGGPTGKIWDITHRQDVPGALAVSHYNGTTWSRPLQITNTDDIDANIVGKTFGVKSGTNGLAGTFTLSSGTHSVASTAITADMVIIPSLKTESGTPGTALPMIKLDPGVGFNVAGNAGDNSTYNWVAFRKA